MARILIADDDAATRDLVRRALESEGHTVTLAEDGSEALELFAKPGARFDLLVSDIEMPGLDGVTLIARLRQSTPGLRAVLMSGFSGSIAEAGKLGSPAPRVLSKPFTLDQMRAEVRAALA